MSEITPLKKENKVFELMLTKDVSDEGVFEGYGSIFGNKDSYGDIVERGAFADYLSRNNPANVKLLWQHNPDEPIGVYEEVREDDKGLYVRGRLLIDDIAKAREAYALLKAKAITGLSIGFTINKNGSEYDQDGSYTRRLKSLSLWEISVVTFPANQRAKVASVKEEGTQKIDNVRDFENFLRDSGLFSNTESVNIANHGFIKGLQRDVEDKSNEKLSQDIFDILSALKNGVKQL